MANVTNPTFENKIRRGQPDNAGKFASKDTSAPTATLSPYSRVAPVVPYRGEPIARRLGAPSEVTHGETMVLDSDRQAGGSSYFTEEHELEDGRYLTSVHYAYALDRASGDSDVETTDLRVALETEQFVSDEQGAYDMYGHLERQEEQASFTRQVSNVSAGDVAEARRAAEHALEDVCAYQTTFNREPFAGSFADDDVEAFADALPSIRAAYGLR